MEKNWNYYHDLVVFELTAEKRMDTDLWLCILRMVNNPCIQAEQKILFDDMSKGHYLIKVTESVMDTMKMVTNLKSVKRIEKKDERKVCEELWKQKYPQW